MARCAVSSATTGQLNWTFQTGGVIKYPPTIAHGNAYVGSGDGHAYCLDASTGRDEVEIPRRARRGVMS